MVADNLGSLWFVDASLQPLPPSSYGCLPSVCLCESQNSFCLSLIRTSVIGFSACSKSRMNFLHYQLFMSLPYTQTFIVDGLNLKLLGMYFKASQHRASPSFLSLSPAFTLALHYHIDPLQRSSSHHHCHTFEPGVHAGSSTRCALPFSVW